jgi:ArsR family transcriptional regulator, arsenate/arsenite/antimonite-responsive transcriptional repressor
MLISVDSDALRVLADPLRIRIVTLLAREELCVCHLAEETGARQTNLSNHLRVLREAGLVEPEPYGRFTYYRLRPGPLDNLAATLSGLAESARVTAGRERKRPCT